MALRLSDQLLTFLDSDEPRLAVNTEEKHEAPVLIQHIGISVNCQAKLRVLKDFPEILASGSCTTCKTLTAQC